jgi:hypothetical protein
LKGRRRSGEVLFYLVAVWESVRLEEYRDSRLPLNEERDDDNLRDSGKLFQSDAPILVNTNTIPDLVQTTKTMTLINSINCLKVICLRSEM